MIAVFHCSRSRSARSPQSFPRILSQPWLARAVGAIGLCLVLLFGWGLQSAPAWAASSAAIRAYDDAEVRSRDFTGQDLRRAEFASENLAQANFQGADLQGAVFNGSNLSGANLQGVDFSNGIGYLSNFNQADLTNAVLADSMLLRSTFKGAKIEGADFTYAAIDRLQAAQLCEYASGTNPKTGVMTRESLECP